MEIKFYCPSPWYGTFVTPAYSSVCCGHSGIAPNDASSFFADEHIKEIRRSFTTDTLDRDCQQCQRTESNGGHSLATKFKTTYQQAGIKFDPIVDIANIDAPLTPQYLELRFSNHCNFGCRTCFPSFSNKIGKDIINNPELKPLYNETEFGLQTTSPEFIDELMQRVDQYKWINITGGEPMLMPETIEFLDRVTKAGRSEEVVLHLTTNVSTINAQVIENLKKFKRVMLTLSIDATDKAAEYIRYGTVWPHIDRNIKIYNNLSRDNNNIEVTFNATFSSYALFDLDKTFKYLSQWRNNEFSWIGGNIASGLCDPHNLSGHARQRAIEGIERGLESLQKHLPRKQDIDTMQTQLEGFKRVLETQQPDPHRWIAFVRQTQLFDRIRNQNFKDVFGFDLV